MGEKPKLMLDEVSEYEEKKIGLLNLPDMEMEISPPSKEGKMIRKLLTLLIDNKLICLDDLTILSLEIMEKHIIMISKSKGHTKKYLWGKVGDDDQ